MLRDNAPISLPVQYLVMETGKGYADVLGFDCDQTAADAAVFEIPFKCVLQEVGVVVTETCGGTTKPIVDFDLRPTAGSDDARGAADLGYLVLSTTAAGKVMYDLVGKGTTLIPGSEIVCELSVAAATNPTGHCRPYVLVEYVPEVLANLTAKVVTA